MKFSELLEASGLPPLEARVLLAHALGVTRAWLAAYGDENVRDDALARVESLYGRRAAGEPVAYLTGEREFYGLDFAVGPAVLIPRPETELLVEAALEHLDEAGSALDLGTGSGAIAVALAHARARARISAGEASPQALELAHANAARHGARIRFVLSDWFSAFAGERFDLVVSNPPYIASGDPHLGRGDLRFEPRAALEAGPTGLECIEHIAAGALAHLAPGGWLLLEHGHEQGEACVALLRGLGYERVSDRDDLAGLSRVAAGRRPMAH